MSPERIDMLVSAGAIPAADGQKLKFYAQKLIADLLDEPRTHGFRDRGFHAVRRAHSEFARAKASIPDPEKARATERHPSSHLNVGGFNVL
jgi:hypothetical protein